MNTNYSASQSCSLISREGSTAIKGLLIFLIILGHNSLFSSLSRIGMVYLYTFHIHAFFLLPFLYPVKSIDKHRITDYFVRLYYPFILFFIILSILNYIAAHFNLIPNGNVEILHKTINPQWLFFIITLINGNAKYIDYFTGFQFLWFLPVMFSMYILRDFYYSKISNLNVKYIIIILCLLCYLAFIIFGFRTPYNQEINDIILFYSPFAITKALGYLFMGLVILFLIKKKNQSINVLIHLIFFSGTLICFICQKGGDVPIEDNYRWGLMLLMPFSFFYLLYNYNSILSKIPFLIELGKYSFPIYIIHPFLLKIISAFIQNYNMNCWITVIIVQIIVTILSLFISKYLYSNTLIKRYIFPHKWADFKIKN